MMSADSVSCCCKEQGGLNGSKSRRFMVLIKMDPYSDASIIWLTDGWDQKYFTETFLDLSIMEPFLPIVLIVGSST